MSYFPSRRSASILACFYLFVLVLSSVVVQTATADKLSRELLFDRDELLNTPADKLLMKVQLSVEANIRTLEKATTDAIKIQNDIETKLPRVSVQAARSLGKELCSRGGPTDDFLAYMDMRHELFLQYNSAYELFKEKSDS